MPTLKVTFDPHGRTVEAQTGESLLNIAARNGIEIPNLCGGQGVCGKCRVRITHGEVDFSADAMNLLDRKELREGFVLACRTRMKDEDVRVWVPVAADVKDQVLTEDAVSRYDPPTVLQKGRILPDTPYFRPLSQKILLELPEPSLADNISDLERIYRELRKKTPYTDARVDFACLRGLSASLREHGWRVTATLHWNDPNDPSIRSLEGGNTSSSNLGVAIDVGTTTVVAQLVDLRTGTILGVKGCHNRQAHFGADVISRMIFACTRDGMRTLTNSIIETIDSLVDSLLAEAHASTTSVTCFVVAGNTTMTHLLLGLEPCTIRLEPYIPTANRFPPVSAAELGLKSHPTALVHCLPCVSSYVGGDITAGVLACGMNDRAELSALIDVGTNGEIVIGNSEWLVCCSASAGPAFEGGGIKCGRRATTGAIHKVSISRERVSCQTIGGGKPSGICGSALIDTLAELFAEGIIDERGKFVRLDDPRLQVIEDVPEFILAPGSETATGEPVVITEDDISNLIKSKAAVLAAMKLLLDQLGMSFKDLHHVYVAGGFGSHLDVENAIMIGLLPDLPKRRIRFIGNSSLAGARSALLSTHAFTKARAIARQMTYYELSAHPEFMTEFVAALFLPHTQRRLFPTVKEKLAKGRNKA
ncbi:MAG: ASKHA domain-containing protein [Syntrophobacteraceae bacterium]|nr:ASKHA domain-containing protein [Desulfobacteraceae bacterium]